MYFTEHTFQINVKYTYNNLVLQKLVQRYSPLLRTNFISSLILEISHMTSNIAWSCFHVSSVADLHDSTCSAIVLHVFSVSI
jgi:hypothetical protein